VCDLCVLSGDDPLTLPMMIAGGKGVISVASNVAPRPVADLVHAALKGDWARAAALHREYFRLFTEMFLDTNPIPVKTALSLMGLIEDVYRLPLCPTSPAIKAKLADCLKAYRLI
jgi:4-hydroxy-tetrahydrodipicolinate synthase